MKSSKTILITYAKLVPENFRSDILFAGGAQKYIFETACNLKKDGYNLIVGSDDDNDARIVLEMRKYGIHHVKLPFSSGGFRMIESFKGLLNVLKDYKVDILHCNDRKSAPIGKIVSDLLGIRMVYTAHNVFNNKKITRFSFGKNIIAVSEGVKKNLLEYFKIDPAKITVIYNGTSIKKPSVDTNLRILKEFDFQENDRIISFIGRLSEQKGVFYLLEALREVIIQFPYVKLLIIGEGELREDLKTTMLSFGLQSNVLFCGNRKDVAGLIEISEFMISPSLWEGLGISTIESITLGKPVIASSVGGLPEVITDGINGRLVPPKDSKALATAICSFLRDPVMVKRMGEEAQKIAKEKFSSKKVNEEYSNYFKSKL
jgi:glycosyltransferase involved in cell wall biosynthesis